MANRYQYSKREDAPDRVDGSALALNARESREAERFAQSGWDGERLSEYHIALDNYSNVLLDMKAQRINDHNERNYASHASSGKAVGKR